MQYHSQSGETDILREQSTMAYGPVPVPPKLTVQLPKVAGRNKACGKLTVGEVEQRFNLRRFGEALDRYLDCLWGPELVNAVCGPIGAREGTVRIHIYNSVVYYYQPFQQLKEVVKVFLKCPPGGSPTQPNAIWIRENEDRTLDTFQGRRVVIPSLYFEYLPPRRAMLLPAAEGKIKYKVVTRTDRAHETVIYEREPLPIGLAFITYTTYAKPDGKPDRLHGCTEVMVQS